MIYLSVLLVLNLVDAQGETRTPIHLNASCHQNDFICNFLDFKLNRGYSKDVEIPTQLNQLLFSWIDKRHEKQTLKERRLQNESDILPGSPKSRLHAFVKTQIKRMVGKKANSRALRAAMRLAISADCDRPAVVCIASYQTCQRWEDYSIEVKISIEELGRVLKKYFEMRNSRFGSMSLLRALGNIKGALLLVVKNPNILTNMNWFSNHISPRGTVEASDCVYLISETKEDALYILSESAWNAAARYVLVINKQLRDSYQEDLNELLSDGSEDEGIGVDIDELVTEEYDLKTSHKDGSYRTVDTGSLDLHRDRRDISGNMKNNKKELSAITGSKLTSNMKHDQNPIKWKCAVWSHNLLGDLWNNRRFLRTALYVSGCNVSSNGFIRNNVSTFPVFLLSQSGERVVLSGNEIALALKILRSPLTNLGGRTLRISLFERIPTVMLANAFDRPSKLVGQDAWLLRLTAHSLNFRVLVEEPENDDKFGYFFENGTSSGTISNLVYPHRTDVSNSGSGRPEPKSLRGKADISFNGFLVMDYGTRAVAFSSPFSFDELCVVVPRTGALPGWVVLLTTLPPIVIAVTPPTILALTLLLAAIRRFLHFRGSIISDLLSVISVCLTVSTRMPNVCSQRLLLMGATVASLVITGAFQGLIVRSIAVPRYPAQIDTLKALDESGFTIVTGSETLQSTFDVPGSSVTMKNLLSKTIVIHSQSEYFEYVKQSARIVRRAGIEGALNSDQHLVKECPRHYPVAFLMQRGSPFADALNSLLLRFAAAGITEMLISWSHKDPPPQLQEDTPQKVFSLEDLQGPFIVLCCGLGLSTLIFLVEIRVLWCHTSKTNLPKRRVKSRQNI